MFTKIKSLMNVVRYGKQDTTELNSWDYRLIKLANDNKGTKEFDQLVSEFYGTSQLAPFNGPQFVHGVYLKLYAGGLLLKNHKLEEFYDVLDNNVEAGTHFVNMALMHISKNEVIPQVN